MIIVANKFRFKIILLYSIKIKVIPLDQNLITLLTLFKIHQTKIVSLLYCLKFLIKSYQIWTIYHKFK